MSQQPFSIPEEDLRMEDIIRYLQEAREGAMESRQFSTAVRAAELMGKHLGMFGKREEQQGPVEIRWAGEDF
ncbi:MAG: hypothetical protein JEZ02_00165 [Desulfatibacillum sp.]|nr:hypothetical protein [Desulfatibacillum sp.]